MREVYVYDEFCNDFDNLGLVGALTPTSCEHEEIAGGMSEVILVHPIDETGKYKALEKGRIIKAVVPVRTTPEIDGSTVVTTVWKYHVKASSSKEQRKVWSKREEGKKLGSLKANQEVIVVKRNDAWSRYKVKAKKLNGWVDKAALEEDAVVQLPNNDPTAIEDIYPLWGDKEQLFRIYSEDRSDTEITVHARHISYDLLTNMTMYKNNQEVSLAQAVNGVFNQCVEDHDFTVQTNVADTKVGVDYRHSNPINALFDPEVGILKKWDVQLVRDDYELTILKTVGKNRGMSIEYGRNLTGVTCTIDTSNVVTCVLPTGVDHNGKPLYLTDDVLVNGHPNPNNYVFAKQSIRDMYPFEHIYHLECEDATEGSEEANDKTHTYRPTKSKVRERMLEQAYEVLWEDKDHHGEDDQANANTMPTVSLQVQFVTLGDTEEYKQFKDLERLFLYDKVRVRVPKLNIDMLLDAVRVKTDCLTGHTVEVEIGAIQDIEVSVPSWAITSLNGGKIVAGSIPAGSFGPGVITADAIFANAITADKIAANTITADKMSANQGEFVNLVAQNLTADTFSAHYADIDTLVAGTVQATDISADQITTGTLDASQATITNIDAGNINTGTLQASVIGAGTITAQKLSGQYASFEALVTQNLTTNAIEAQLINAGQITSQSLSTAFAGIADAQISSLRADDVRITHLTADYASMTNSQITHATITTAQIKDGNIEFADIVTATIDDAFVTQGAFQNLDTAVLTAVEGELETASIDYLKSTALTATMGTIADGKIGELNAKNIKVDDTVSAPYIIGQDGYFTGAINASTITAGTLVTDRLLLRGPSVDGNDSIVYKLNVLASGDIGTEITQADLATTEYKNHIHGENLVVESITAQQIHAGTIDTTKVTDTFGAGLIISSNTSITSLQGDVDSLGESLETSYTMISQSDDKIEAVKQTVSDQGTVISDLSVLTDGFKASITELQNATAPVTKWMKFDSSDFLTIGQSDSPFSVQITNEALNFKRGDDVMAYVNNEKFFITDGQVTNSLKIKGYQFRPHTGNGQGMSLVYTGA